MSSKVIARTLERIDVMTTEPNALLARLQTCGALFSIDADFGRLLLRLDPGGPGVVPLLGALASHAVQTGHVCLSLSTLEAQVLDGTDTVVELSWPPRATLDEALAQSSLVGHDAAASELRPLIRDDDGRIFLQRYAAYQARLVAQLKRRQKTVAGVDEALLEVGLERLFGPLDATAVEEDQQRLACALSVRNHFTVISGGPGTGKTTTVAKVLLLLREQATAGGGAPLTFALLAPTGKAAQRLGAALLEGLERAGASEAESARAAVSATTIHRALGFNRRSPTRFLHDAQRPLAADVVVVDEASMVDLALMTKLVEAVAPDARLILLGDKDQLASVEAGAIFGDIFNPSDAHRHSPSTEAFERRVGALQKGAENTRPAGPPAVLATSEPLPIVDCTVGLTRSYRYAADSGIGRLAVAVRRGDADAIEAALTDDSARRLGRTLVEPQARAHDPQLLEALVQGYTAYAKASSAEARLAELKAFRVLCATRRGPRGVEGLNRAIEAALSERGLLAVEQPFYSGRPLIITENDYGQSLFNGDIGVVAFDENRGRSVAVFEHATGHRTVPVSRLPAHETVFAMTVHKSQGSEFDQVLLILPETPSAVLSRELLYTGITRARRTILVSAPTPVLQYAAGRQLERHSGLRDALWR
jgi:exodeoxyribonuclease V alpha subunit